MDTKLEQAMLRVQDGRKRIAAQLVLLEKLKVDGSNTAEAERLLTEYEADQTKIEAELNQLLRKAGS